MKKFLTAVAIITMLAGVLFLTTACGDSHFGAIRVLAMCGQRIPLQTMYGPSPWQTAPSSVMRKFP